MRPVAEGTAHRANHRVQEGDDLVVVVAAAAAAERWGIWVDVEGIITRSGMGTGFTGMRMGTDRGIRGDRGAGLGAGVMTTSRLAAAVGLRIRIRCVRHSRLRLRRRGMSLMVSIVSFPRLFRECEVVLVRSLLPSTSLGSAHEKRRWEFAAERRAFRHRFPSYRTETALSFLNPL